MKKSFSWFHSIHDNTQVDHPHHSFSCGSRVHTTPENSAGPIQLLLCCKGAESSLCKIPWVDCVHKDTSDGNLQTVLFYSSFTLYFRMNLFALVGTSLEMHILQCREHLSGVDFAFHLHSSLREFSLVMQLSLQGSWSFLPMQFQNHDLGISLPSSRHGLLLLLQL